MITLTTDFGTGFYVGQMKGAIFRINEDAKIIDISHEIKKHDIFEGAFVLSQFWEYFPAGTTHVGVVDPGVGSSRKWLIIETETCFFVGPDNGLFSLACKEQKVKKIIAIDESKLKKFSKDISATFHGRDIFAPVAALLDNGHKPEEFGKVANVMKNLEMGKNRILYIDSFGNIITSISKEFSLNGRIKLKHKNKILTAKSVKTFSDGKKGELLFLKGSHGFFEIDVREENAAEKLKAKVGDRIEILSR